MFFGVPACPSPEGVTAQPAINTANASRRLRHNLPVSAIDRTVIAASLCEPRMVISSLVYPSIATVLLHGGRAAMFAIFPMNRNPAPTWT
jgi:hypothetical protein